MPLIPPEEQRPGTALRIFETVLYADDLIAAEGFYREVMGLEVISRSDLLVSFRCANSVLLIFNPALSSQPGRDVPSHGTAGAGHVAFALRPEDFDVLESVDSTPLAWPSSRKWNGRKVAARFTSAIRPETAWNWRRRRFGAVAGNSKSPGRGRGAAAARRGVAEIPGARAKLCSRQNAARPL